MKKFFSFICIIFILLFVFVSCDKTISNEAFYKLAYENKVDSFFPSVSIFPESCSFDFYDNSEGGLFPTDKLSMKVSFASSELYEKQKKQINLNEFLTVDMIGKKYDTEYYIFKTGNDYPNNFCFVGYNDSALEISYFWYFSQDQDYVGDFEEFVEEEYEDIQSGDGSMIDEN